MDLLLIMAVVAVVAVVVTAPLRAGRAAERDLREAAVRADLDARKEAKYREIREAEMDWRTGKLSEADYRELDRRLRREAVDLLKELDALYRRASTLPGVSLYSLLAVVQVFIAVVLIFTILLHSGKDSGMSGAFGVGVAGGNTGGSLMERNLTRWTITFAILFVVNTIVLLKL